MLFSYHNLLFLTGSSDIIVTDVISFNPSQSKMTIQVEVPENALHEMQAKVFTVSLAAIRAVNARIDEAMISTGDPVKITVYDNDCKYNYEFSTSSKGVSSILNIPFIQFG